MFGEKETSAVNRGFVWFTLCMFSPIWGKGNGRNVSGFAVNWGAVNQGFTVYHKHKKLPVGLLPQLGLIIISIDRS